MGYGKMSYPKGPTKKKKKTTKKKSKKKGKC